MKNKCYTNMLYITFFIGLLLNSFFFFKSPQNKDFLYLIIWGIGFPIIYVSTKLVQKSKYGWYSIVALCIYLYYIISISIDKYFIFFNYNWNKEFININLNFADFIPLKTINNLFYGIYSFSIVINVLFWVISLIFITSYIIQPGNQKNKIFNGLFSLIIFHVLILLIFPITAPYLNDNSLYSGDTFNVINDKINSFSHINHFIIGSLPSAIIVYISLIILRQNIIFGIFMLLFSFFLCLAQLVLNYCYITDIIISIILSINAFFGLAGGLKKNEYI